MTERLLEPGQEIIVKDELKLQMAAALSHHVTAKDMAHLDAMRQEDTMQRILDLASVRGGIDALKGVVGE